MTNKGVIYCMGQNKYGECNLPNVIKNRVVKSISAGNNISCTVVEIELDIDSRSNDIE